MSDEKFRKGLFYLVEYGGLKLPHKIQPGSIPTGELPISTKADWDAEPWNPPRLATYAGYEKFLLPDPNASDKPPWVDIMAASDLSLHLEAEKALAAATELEPGQVPTALLILVEDGLSVPTPEGVDEEDAIPFVCSSASGITTEHEWVRFSWGTGAGVKPTWAKIVKTIGSLESDSTKESGLAGLSGECRRRITLAFGASDPLDELFIRQAGDDTAEQRAERVRLLAQHKVIRETLRTMTLEQLESFDPELDAHWVESKSNSG